MDPDNIIVYKLSKKVRSLTLHDVGDGRMIMENRDEMNMKAHIHERVVKLMIFEDVCQFVDREAESIDVYFKKTSEMGSEYLYEGDPIEIAVESATYDEVTKKIDVMASFVHPNGL